MKLKYTQISYLVQSIPLKKAWDFTPEKPPLPQPIEKEWMK